MQHTYREGGEVNIVTYVVNVSHEVITIVSYRKPIHPIYLTGRVKTFVQLLHLL